MGANKAKMELFSGFVCLVFFKYKPLWPRRRWASSAAAVASSRQAGAAQEGTDGQRCAQQ